MIVVTVEVVEPRVEVKVGVVSGNMTPLVVWISVVGEPVWARLVELLLPVVPVGSLVSW